MSHEHEEAVLKGREPALEPDLPIVDPHHHLRDREGFRYMLPEFLADVMTGHNVRSTVVVETSAFYRADGPEELRPVGETEFFNGIAAMAASGQYGPCKVCDGIVGYTDLRLGSRAKGPLEAHIAAGNGRFKGIRNTVSWDEYAPLVNKRANPPPHLLADRTFREGFACLSQLGLSFDVWLYHPQLPDLVTLARDFPSTTIIVNHIGGPVGIGPYAGKRDEVFATWRASMRDLAKNQNVYVKLGGIGLAPIGFGFHGRKNPPNSTEIATVWRPYAEAVIEDFGVHRCMFEGNLPPDKESCDYTVSWNTFKRIAAKYSADEKAALFAQTAIKAYRLSPI